MNVKKKARENLNKIKSDKDYIRFIVVALVSIILSLAYAVVLETVVF